MKRRISGFTLTDLGVVIVVVFLAFLIFTFLMSILERPNPYHGYLGACLNNLHNLGAAQQAYMSTNGDYWAFQHDERDFAGQDPARGRNAMFHNSSMSLSILYPRWIDDINVFKCPSTKDAPIIGKQRAYENGPLYTWFFSHHTRDFDGGEPGNGYHIPAYRDQDSVPPGVGVTGFFSNGRHGASYGYDDTKGPRDMMPGTALMAEMHWMDEDGTENSNHVLDGINVLYWDGGVAFRDTNYASVHPQDNIFKRAWDQAAGEFALPLEEDTVIVRTHRDGLLGTGRHPDREWW